MSDFGDISTRVGVFASTMLLHDAKANLVLPRFCKNIDVPKNRGTTLQLRRYKNIPVALAPISGARTPDGVENDFSDMSISLDQYGSWIPVPKYIQDTIEDNLLQETTLAASYQMARTLETVTYNEAVGGTQKIRGGFVAATTSVVTTLTNKELKAASRTLRMADVMPVTKLIDATPKYGTSPIEPAFYAYCSPDLEPTIRGLTNFKSFAEYGNPGQRLPGELGAVGDIRFITSTIAAPLPGAGGAVGATKLKSTSGKVDIYPILIFGEEAFGCSKISGVSDAKIMVHNAQVSASDPLGQRGSVGWLTWYGAFRLYEDRCIRLEVGCMSDAGLT